MRCQGFILQSSYRIIAGRPVVYLYGRLADGATFLARDHRPVPHFYIAAADAPTAQREFHIEVQPGGMAAIQLSKEIAKQIEESMQYPGQIKVTVIRETRAVDYAK